MDNQINLSDLYQIIGEKDVLIFKLNQQIQILQKKLEETELQLRLTLDDSREEVNG